MIVFTIIIFVCIYECCCVIVRTVIAFIFFFFFQAEDGIRDVAVTGVQTCALPISPPPSRTFAQQSDCRRCDGACPARTYQTFRSKLRAVAQTARTVDLSSIALLTSEGNARQVHSPGSLRNRSEEHTSELQSRLHLVCRLLLEKKKDT